MDDKSMNDDIDKSVNNDIMNNSINNDIMNNSINNDIMNNINMMNNSDLIENIESAAINYIVLVKEAIFRIGGKQFSDEEYKRFVDIGEKMGISIIDFVSIVKSDVDKYKTKEVVTRAVSEVIDKAYDKDR